MSVELPTDAEGREIPLDVEFLYGANGESVKPYSFTFSRYDGFDWDMHLVGAPNLVYDPESFYLTPPDSWEMLEEDLNRCISGDSACRYFAESENCEDCRIDKNNEQGGCVELVFKDIVRRIRKLRGED